MADGRERLVVLGGGIAGLASAWFAASLSDLEVVVVEREPRHDAHSSGRSAEIQRIAIPDPVARELAVATDGIYANPEGSGFPADFSLVDRVGLVVAHPAAEPEWRRDLEGRVEMQPLGADEARRRAPHTQLQAAHATWFPTAGQVNAPRLLATLARSCAARGVRFVRSSGEASIEVEGGRVRGVAPGRGDVDRRDARDQRGRGVGRGGGRRGRRPLSLRPTRRHMLAFARDARAAAPPVVWDDAAALYVRARGDRWLVSPCDVEDAAPDGEAADTRSTPGSWSAPATA